MTRFGRASRQMDIFGLALMTMMMLLLWVQHSALAADGGARAGTDPVGAVTEDGGSTGSVASAGAQHL